MATTKEKWQEIANRGLQDRFDPQTRAKFDEAVRRGLITVPSSPPQSATVATSEGSPEILRPSSDFKVQPIEGVALPKGLAWEDIQRNRAEAMGSVEKARELELSPFRERLAKGQESGYYSTPEEDPLGARRPMTPPTRSRLEAAITGSPFQTEETKKLPETIGINSGDILADARRGLNLMLAASDEERIRMLQKAVPDAKLRYDRMGNVIAKFPNGQEGVVNKPGISRSDLWKTATEIAKYAGAGTTAAKLGTGALSKLGWSLGTSAALATGYETASAAAGGEFNPAEIAYESIGAAIGEIPSLLKSARSYLRGRKSGLLPSQQAIKDTVLKLTGDEEAAMSAVRSSAEFEESARAVGGEGVATFAQKSGLVPLTERQTFLSMLGPTQAYSQRILEGQNKKVSEIVQSFIERYAPVEVLEDGAARFKVAAQEALQGELKKLQARAKPFYDRARAMNPNVDLTEPRRLVGEFMRDLPQEGKLSDKASAALRSAREYLRGIEVSDGVRKKPTFAQLESAKKRLDELINPPDPGESLGNEISGKLGAIKNALVEQMDLATRTDPSDPLSSVYAQARGIYSDELPQIIALKEGLLGKVGRMKDANFKKMSSEIFDAAETDPSVLKRVRDLVEKVSPGAMDDMLGLELARSVNTVRAAEKGNLPAKLLSAMFEPTGKFRALINGSSPEAKKNLMHIKRFLEGLAEGRPGGSKTAFNEQFARELDSGFLRRLTEIAGKLRSGVTLGTMASDSANEALRRQNVERNAQAFARILFSQENASQMEAIRKIGLDTPGKIEKTYQALSRLYDEAFQAIESQETETFE